MRLRFFASLFISLIIAAPIAAAQTVVSEGFAALSGAATTLTNATVVGDVGVDVGAVTVTASSVVGTIHNGDTAAMEAYDSFLDVYGELASEPCTAALNTVYTDATLTLAPGVYCADAAVTFTRTELTLDAMGDADAVWVFKIGTLGTGALTGTGLSVVLANNAQPSNVFWWLAEAATLTGSSVKGSVLAGAGATMTGGSLVGQLLAEGGVTVTGGVLVDASDAGGEEPPPCVETCCKDHKHCKDKHCKKHCKPKHCKPKYCHKPCPSDCKDHKGKGKDCHK